MSNKNHDLQIFKGRVVCPLCDGNGLIYKAEIQGVKEPVYICDECEALWKNIEEIKSIREESLMSFLEKHEINPKDNSKLIDLGYDWINERS